MTRSLDSLDRCPGLHLPILVRCTRNGAPGGAIVMQRHTGKGDVMALGERDVTAITFADSNDNRRRIESAHAPRLPAKTLWRRVTCQGRYIEASFLMIDAL